MSLIRLSSGGRGSHYGALRGLMESSLRIAYRADWPARLWGVVRRSCRIELLRHRLALLPPGAAPLTIGFISDIHIGPTTPVRLLETAFACLAAEKLDLLLLGGDYVFLDATPEKAELLAALVSSVPAARKFAVLGNHDLWTEHARLEAALERASVELISNAHVLFESAGGTLGLVGLDEPWTGTIDAERAFAGLGTPHTVVVLCHSPDGLPDALAAMRALPGSPNGLYVCGHTHGGHVATPWGPLVIPGRVGKQYPHGYHHVPPLHVHVSRGVGGSEVPFRTYARPDVAVFELVARA